MDFDLITGFSHNDNAITLKRDESEFTISIEKYSECLEKLIDILEAKGKTFDKERTFMVRPVTISIKDDQIIIKDVKLALTNLEILSSKIAKNYPNVTPGFIEEIIPRNTSFDKVYYKGKDLYIECSHFEVRDGHPENVGFENMQVTDGIIVFTEFKVVTLSKRDVNERSQKFTNLKTYKKTVEEELTKAVVSEWRFQRKSGELILASGVGAVKIIFNFDDTLIGWKE
jgi:hypothetical protein